MHWKLYLCQMRTDCCKGSFWFAELLWKSNLKKGELLVILGENRQHHLLVTLESLHIAATKTIFYLLILGLTAKKGVRIHLITIYVICKYNRTHWLFLSCACVSVCAAWIDVQTCPVFVSFTLLPVEPGADGHLRIDLETNVLYLFCYWRQKRVSFMMCVKVTHISTWWPRSTGDTLLLTPLSPCASWQLLVLAAASSLTTAVSGLSGGTQQRVNLCWFCGLG